MTTRYVALLRGINVGGRNRLPMKELTGLLEEIGCRSVETWIQSGNVVFEADPGLAERVTEVLPELIEVRFGHVVPVVLRTGDEVRAVTERNPFLQDGVEPKSLHVGFLAEAPGADAVAGLDHDRSTVDSFVVSGREVFFHIPGGMARTRLTTAYFDRALDTVMTVRNWRTICRLQEMVSAG